MADPLLPFNEALMEPIEEVWKKPVTSSAVNSGASAGTGFSTEEFGESIRISRDTAVDLRWWAADGKLSQGKPFSLPTAVTTVITDASTLEWGAHLGDLEIKGRWSPVEQMFHINLLELRAIRLALKALLPSLRGQSGQILTNNTSTMWYINKQGGVGS
ncbi:hypothetical protein NDU88_002843 [Pleurodeles waltl]|uniref:Uncharacterized protein n=1 Tax=Pleurodeles waltl TaxID=8319 RepID=A0AAV7NES1_PLEWA|nr:hypothetical protein NDU88_002843 [Pleurodeles waltl]